MAFSLDDIACGVLRGNPSSFPLGKRFKKGDKRLDLVLKNPSKYISYGLIDLSEDSPRLTFISPNSSVDTQLEGLCKSYLQEFVKVKNQGVISVPKYVNENSYDYTNGSLAQITTFLTQNLQPAFAENEALKKAFEKPKFVFELGGTEKDFRCLLKPEKLKEYMVAIPLAEPHKAASCSANMDLKLKSSKDLEEILKPRQKKKCIVM